MRASIALTFAVGVAVLATAHASEQSELLVARGEVAYAAGRFDEAHALFADAVAADPRDAGARFALALALGKLGRWEASAATFREAHALDPRLTEAERGMRVAASEAAKDEAPTGRRRPFGVRGAAGMQVDSNVRLDPSDTETSGAAVFQGGAHWEAWRDTRSLVRLDYSLLQTVQTNVGDFDFGWNGVRGTASVAALPALWLGVHGGFDHYTLGFDAWMLEPWVGPFLNVVAGDLGLTHVAFRRGWQQWLGSPFDGVRDGPTNAVGVTQMLYPGDPAQWLAVGWQYDDEAPYTAAGDDYRRGSQQALVAAGVPAWWDTQVELTYVYRHDVYTEPSTYGAAGARRRDDRHEVLATVRRPLAPWLAVAVYWDAVWNDSNVGLFQYRRQVVGAAVEVAY